MRPTRLEMEGFTAFQRHTVVDFTDADLFALTGPTGSGKSSVIDALVFALYGSVPRLDDRRSVAPVIHLGANEARIRLDFTVDGAGYTAARVVRRTKQGATTKEARLERRTDHEVLAGNAQEVTAQVESLLGLSFDHFTKCVVLPQGEFQQFLHAQGRDRQDLLVKLLGLDLYERMAKAARGRASAAEGEATVAEALTGELAFATPEAKADATHRLNELASVQAEVAAQAPRLQQLGAEETEARTEAEAAAQRARTLSCVSVPEGLSELGAALAHARDAVTTLEAGAERTEHELSAAELARSSRSPRHRLEAALDAHARQMELAARRADAEVELARAAEGEADAAASCTAADAAVRCAQDQLEAARTRHRAHDLAAALETGRPCPVCQQEVSALPEAVDGGVEVDQASQALASVQAHHERALAARATAQQEHAGIRARLVAIAEQLDDVAAVLSQFPDASAVTDQLEALSRAEAAEADARSAASVARKEAQQARKVLDGLSDQETAARKRFERARGALVPLGAPVSDTDDLVVEWAALASWAQDEAPAHQAAAAAASTKAGAAADERAQLEALLVGRCAGAGVQADASRLSDALGAAIGRAEAEVERINAAMAKAAEHRKQAEAHRRSAALAGQLALHLSANRFEKWVLDEALLGVVARATELLRDLSAGAYSLALEPDTSNFAVVDHRNAHQHRPARTLSGGETFLASLALALALADQLTELASEGSARLDSIFLDEGFGSLDPETLDTVASAIEELGSRGRMVGVISHVAELAERVPVRFEVSRGPSSSSIGRVLL